MSNLVDHAKRELKVLGMSEDSEDEMNRSMYGYIIEMVETFSNQGHSGFSANYAAGVLFKLLNYEPLAPLAGEDDEWTEVSDTAGEPLWQNKRCSHVFKDKEGAYDIEGIIFRDPDGSTWVNRESHVRIEFPYVPSREYVDRELPEEDEVVS